ncbi:orotate phosphoribosyltransferase [Compostibacillus humi]|uniref:Orotate phosphoribosyltransferase n=1 Tax=Compostibacillus humi TaxID=1245525 RepID=A0A8J3EIW0_9BACI|nr:orotate phosphoribosyltransferase [Compostibacillus humi]GGH73541.1 orotate phosphoribosyltransferase [Compostibacillus humi]
MKNLSKEILHDLLKIQAVQINPDEFFTWTSGIKSPIYCDNRLTMSYPEIRRKITGAFLQMIEEMDVRPDFIAGCATAGIPHAAWLAEKLDLPLVYVRSERKAHGKKNQIEGTFRKGQRAIVIEDLISTGTSSIETALALRKEGAEVAGVLAIFSYGLDRAKYQFEAADLIYTAITNYDECISLLKEKGSIGKEQWKALVTWREQLNG